MEPVEILSEKPFLLTKKYMALDNLNPVMFAAKHGLTNYIQTKLSVLNNDQKKEVLELANRGGLTALHFASRYGHLETVKTLLTHGASPKLASSLGYLPIHLIFSDNNNAQKVKNLFTLLVKADPETRKARTLDNNSVAHFAATKGIVDVLKDIQLNDPKQINRKNNQSMTPLLMAVINNHVDAAIYLLKNSNNNLTNSNGQNALHIAVNFSTPMMVSSVLPYFDIHSVDNNMNSAFHLAKKSGIEDKISILKNALNDIENEETANPEPGR